MATGGAGRAGGLAELLQAAIWGALTVWLLPRWAPAAAVAGLGAALMVLGGLARLAGRGQEFSRGCAIGALLCAAALVGGFAQSTLVIATRFGSDARDVGLATFAGAMAGLPWLIALPLWRLRGGQDRSGPGAAGLALLVGGLSAAAVAGLSRPAMAWPAQPALVEAAGAARARWLGDGAAVIPSGAGPAVVLLTPWRGGRAGETARGDGADLRGAVESALAKLPAPEGEDAALVLDYARERYGGAARLMPGESGWLSESAGKSPTALWRPKTVQRREVLPLLYAPTVDLPGDAVRFDSAVADAAGARALVLGWSAPPPLTADAARQAALDGARMLIHHQDAAGRFAYVVGGPSGDELGGYNFPRHAGATWFLARVAVRTGDAEVRAGALAGLEYLVQNTTALDDGRAYVRDPTRRDKKVWVGTTALAVLAAVAADHPVAERWGRFVADSVGPDGLVRGELELATQQFPPQDQNPYGQGQTTLALAALVRGGHTQFRGALDRAMTAVNGPYAPGGAGRLVVLDEHWACLAALAARDVSGEAAGWPLCRAYVANEANNTPSEGGGLYLSTGAAGGLAEAVVAAAVLDPAGPWRDSALAFGALFLRSAYRDGDAAFLGKPEALRGGFRDAPGDWDVRMDAVQHIGCALLGVEALLSSASAGSLP